MQHNLRQAGRYVEAFSWNDAMEVFLETIITERPMLHVCSGPVSEFGDVRVDRHVIPTQPGVVANWEELPFATNSFSSVFADPPWNIGYMEQCANFCKDALRVAPIVYVMSPWLWVHRSCRRSKIWIREFPGINQPIIIAKYERIMPLMI